MQLPFAHLALPGYKTIKSPANQAAERISQGRKDHLLAIICEPFITTWSSFVKNVAMFVRRKCCKCEHFPPFEGALALES
ncbi:hypothetical protein L596_004819 [Steinernema carpocapsae]|uniref:Uncharacterized protein n=1 Tax=Steinernema carpocapsae TaxID=34508 RepID=A0A4V6I8H8_STECR|nr:hypothetical protein L596_004819 [Steinernema carpocapsae]